MRFCGKESLGQKYFIDMWINCLRLSGVMDVEMAAGNYYTKWKLRNPSPESCGHSKYRYLHKRLLSIVS